MAKQLSTDAKAVMVLDENGELQTPDVKGVVTCKFLLQPGYTVVLMYEGGLFVVRRIEANGDMTSLAPSEQGVLSQKVREFLGYLRKHPGMVDNLLPH